MRRGAGIFDENIFGAALCFYENNFTRTRALNLAKISEKAEDKPRLTTSSSI